MFYDGLFDINGDGRLDGFEEFLEYKAFDDFSGDFDDELDSDEDDFIDDLDDEEDEDIW